jgi:putative oxidoreductase
MLAGTLMVIGLGTPLVGGIVAIGAAVGAIARSRLPSAILSEMPRMNALIAIIAVAIVLLGPGAMSMDSRLFGRKKITIPSRH